MASIFTFEPDIPRVASPWTKELVARSTSNTPENHGAIQISSSEVPTTTRSVTRLEAEPQEGPVEYKLHLLLRSRRTFSRIRVNAEFTGPPHSKYGGPPSRSVSESAFPPLTTPPAPLTLQTRQHRLEQLTTQLLWRLQQSSPHHSSSDSNFILPSLPDASAELQAPPQPVKLLHGLEESQGALYEIGISDDGTFVGLTEDEMRESLHNLRAMAACLGCVVDVLRKVEVGSADWFEEVTTGRMQKHIRRTSRLVVSEALVKPDLGYSDSAQTDRLAPVLMATHSISQTTTSASSQATAQLRISLTGATMSGKSSLLGTLSTSTLDNGRGKSRLTMLKHRHEITSGITSSVTQELLGYHESETGEVDVINYATRNVSSWIDIHVASAGDRLVFVSDSAGHPRYRRTTVRGLVGWVPHWTILCVPADDMEDSSSRTNNSLTPGDGLGSLITDADLSGAHLDLCLRLQLPLVVVITKLDIASKSGLRATLAKTLSRVKNAGRRPAIIPNTPGSISVDDLQSVPVKALAEVRKMFGTKSEDQDLIVPIVMTSALQGTGIPSLHAVLHELPMPSSGVPLAVKHLESASAVFHIEDVYNKATDLQMLVVSGHLQGSRLSVGDILFAGPCSPFTEESDDSDGQKARRPSNSVPTSKSFPGALGTSSFLSKSRVQGQERRRVLVASIRNLRLPVNTLHADQVGTIGLKVLGQDDCDSLASLRLRKGMILTSNDKLRACSNVVAEFCREDLGSLAVGSHVVLYIASVRASARIVSAQISDHQNEMTRSSSAANGNGVKDDNGMADSISSLASLSLTNADIRVAGAVTHQYVLVTFHFETSREFVQLESRMLVMPGGGPGLFGGAERGEKGAAGLEGFVGRVIEVFE